MPITLTLLIPVYLESEWINIKPGNETIAIIVETTLNLKNYTFYNRSFKIGKEKLIGRINYTPNIAFEKAWQKYYI